MRWYSEQQAEVVGEQDGGDVPLCVSASSARIPRVWGDGRAPGRDPHVPGDRRPGVLADRPQVLVGPQVAGVGRSSMPLPNTAAVTSAGVRPRRSAMTATRRARS